MVGELSGGLGPLLRREGILLLTPFIAHRLERLVTWTLESFYCVE